MPLGGGDGDYCCGWYCDDCVLETARVHVTRNHPRNVVAGVVVQSRGTSLLPDDPISTWVVTKIDRVFAIGEVDRW